MLFTFSKKIQSPLSSPIVQTQNNIVQNSINVKKKTNVYIIGKNMFSRIPASSPCSSCNSFR
jgi:hypothetical protein